MKIKELYSDNEDTLSGVIQEMQTDDVTNFKSGWARTATHCINYMNGQQNPDAFAGVGMAIPSVSGLTLANDQDRMRMYTTNEIEPITKTIQAYMTRQRPTIQAFSLEEDPVISRSISKVAEDVINAKYDLDREGQNTLMSASWALATGICFRKDYWNSDGGTEISPGVKTGKNEVAILSGYQVSTDYSANSWDDIPWIREDYLMDIDWAKMVYRRYSNKISDIKDDQSYAEALSEFEDLKFNLPYGLSSGGRRTTNKCLVSELYIRPSYDYPQGRYIIRVGGQIVFATKKGGENPYFFEMEPSEWHPYTPFCFEEYLGRLYGKGLVEQLLPMQKRLNEINAAILHNANTLAKPNIMAAEGQLKRGVLSGEGSNVYTYKVLPNAGMPTVMQGTALPTQFFKEKEMLIEQMVRIAGTNFIMMGNQPTGVSAGSAIAQLLENSNNQQSPIMARFTEYHARGFTKKLRLIHKFGKLPDKQLNNYISILAQKANRSQVSLFIGSEHLSDDINISIEPTSMVPKSQFQKNENYKGLMQSGFFAPLLAPGPEGNEIRSQLMEKLDLEPLKTIDSVEMKKAAWENERVMLNQQIQVDELDIDAVHIECHRKTIQDPNFLETASAEQYQVLFQHIKAHEAKAQQLQMQEQQAMMQQQMMQAPDGQGVPPGLDANVPAEMPQPSVPEQGAMLE